MTIDFAGVDVDVHLAREETPCEDDFVFSTSAFDSLLGIGRVGDDAAAVAVVANVASVVLVGVE